MVIQVKTEDFRREVLESDRPVMVDRSPELAQQYGVLSIPTVLLFRHGQVAKQIVGAMPKSRLLQELEPALA